MKGYRVGWPAETTAWKVLTFEYYELGNDHTLGDLAEFLGVKNDWPTLMIYFREQYGNAEGVWVCPTAEDALQYYSYIVSLTEDPEEAKGSLIEVEYGSEKVVIELGADGLFVLEPTSMAYINQN